jgi:hypothetical protein
LAPGACAGTRPSQTAGSPPRGPPAPRGGTAKRAGPPQPRRRWRAEGEIQSAGYARRSRPSRGRGRGFDSRRLHWPTWAPTIRYIMHGPAICGRIACDESDSVSKQFRRSPDDRVAGDRGSPGKGASQASRRLHSAIERRHCSGWRSDAEAARARARRRPGRDACSSRRPARRGTPHGGCVLHSSHHRPRSGPTPAFFLRKGVHRFHWTPLPRGARSIWAAAQA